jgi:GNAT superfamily N-acetyltransferase
MTSSPWPATLPARQVRIARPTDQLDRVVDFYSVGLGLPELERFADHQGYRGVLLGLPGSHHHLEFTQHDNGSPCPAPTRDNLLVLSFDDRRGLEQVATRLATLGHRPVEAENPYWTEHSAVTVEDPDGWRVVLMPQPLTGGPEPTVGLEWYTGNRDTLRPLFELAEDSPTELDSYLHAGRVLVATTGTTVVGHLQLVDTDRPDRAELKNMAVREDQQSRGIGGRLIQAALGLLADEGRIAVRVATAAADTDNLRFYQRQGFRVCSVERDAFTARTGYPPAAAVGGMALRDRVWLDLRLTPATHAERTAP